MKQKFAITKTMGIRTTVQWKGNFWGQDFFFLR